MNVLAYTRVSGTSQTDGDGPQRQLLAIQRYAASQGYEIERVYSETITGKSDLEARPQLSQLRADMIANGPKMVLIEKVDRLARDLLVQESIIADFRNQGLEIVSTLEPDLCSKEPTRVLIRQILGAFAEYERAMLVAKLAGARQRLKEQGKLLLGPAPYGMRKVRRDGVWTLQEDRFESAIVERMRRMRDQGYTYKAVADELNSMGIPSRANCKWYPMTVRNVMERVSGPEAS